MRSATLPPMRHALALVLLVLVACLSLAVTGCGTATSATNSTPKSQKPLISTDAHGTPITIPAKAPQRIVSLTAGDSEMLAAVGVSARVIGVDASTNYPAEMAAKPKVTGNDGSPNVEQIIALNPDLVLSWGQFTKQADTALLQAHVNVIALPVADLQGTLTEIRLVGQLTHTSATADSLVRSLQQRIDTVKQKVASAQPVSVYMEVGYAPGQIYAYGGGSFGNELLQDAGGVNIFASDTESDGYPQVSVESVLAASPQVIILTGGAAYGGTPAQISARPGWSEIVAIQSHRVYSLDSDIVQRPGPRLVDALEQVAKMLHPELFS